MNFYMLPYRLDYILNRVVSSKSLSFDLKGLLCMSFSHTPPTAWLYSTRFSLNVLSTISYPFDSLYNTKNVFSFLAISVLSHKEFHRFNRVLLGLLSQSKSFVLIQSTHHTILGPVHPNKVILNVLQKLMRLYLPHLY